MEIIRQVIAYKRYFLDFYEAQTDDVQRKIESKSIEDYRKSSQEVF